jgi:quinol-cytochrome oxidoreductase complex cytochrome b subunit
LFTSGWGDKLVSSLFTGYIEDSREVAYGLGAVKFLLAMEAAWMGNILSSLCGKATKRNY